MYPGKAKQSLANSSANGSDKHRWSGSTKLAQKRQPRRLNPVLAPVADLARHLAERPDAPALLTPRRALSYRQLSAAVLSVSQRLRHAGVKPNDLVALDLPTGLEWVVNLALFRLGARTVSVRGVSDPPPLRPAFLLTQTRAKAEQLAASQVIEVSERWIDEQWIDASTATPSIPPPAEHPEKDAIFRYILTNGTTGQPRAAAYSVGAFDYRVADGDNHWTGRDLELNMVGMSTTGGFHAAAGSLHHGLPYLAIDAIDVDSMRFAERQNIRVLSGSPAQVAHALHVIVEAGITLPALKEVRLAGATPTAQLLDLIHDRLGVPTHGVYGSTESGGLCQTWYGPGSDRFNVGAPMADVELELLDESGMPVPAGTEGSVRYRTPGQVSGYLVDGVVVPLPGGWVTPGDRGAFDPTGALVLAGRDSELLNIGGQKINPALIDEFAAEFPGIQDAAAFGIERRAGIQEVAIALVTDDGCDLRALDAALRARVPVGHPTIYWRIDAIPRGRMGKIQRGKLAERYERDVLRRS